MELHTMKRLLRLRDHILIQSGIFVFFSYWQTSWNRDLESSPNWESNRSSDRFNFTRVYPTLLKSESEHSSKFNKKEDNNNPYITDSVAGRESKVFA